VLETLLSFKRAGADLILTYHAAMPPTGCVRAEVHVLSAWQPSGSLSSCSIAGI
jgi:Delta-aminolevulinic acid dehydratase